MERQFVLSTVGISLLRRMTRDREEQETLIRISNERELPAEPQELVDRLAKSALEELRKGDIEQRRRLSAELNGLYALYDGDLSAGCNDFHWLITTDTTLGQRSAEVIHIFLAEQGLGQIQVFYPPGLSTASTAHFSQGMQRLLTQCEETIARYKDSKYQVVFNLTGGFKSLQGYLSIIGMFYADEIVYIFEGSSELLRIPRLPIQVDPRPIQAHTAQFAMMATGHVLPYEEVSALPEGLLMVDSRGDAAISDWGLLVWNRLKRELLGEALLPFPRIVYESPFRKDFAGAQKHDRLQLQETLAKVAWLLEESKGDTARLKQDGGLQYENYKNKRDRAGTPIGHFRVSQALRVSCVSKGGRLYLRRFGREPDVNSNP